MKEATKCDVVTDLVFKFVKKFKNLHILIRIFICLIIPAGSAVAQNFAGLNGTVFDENGAVIVGATVTIRNLRGNKISAVTDGEGHYVFSNLPTEKIEITANAPGFAETSRTVELAKTIRLDITLKIVVNERIDVQVRRENLTAVTLTGESIASLPADPRQLLLRLQRLAGTGGAAENLVVYVDGFREDGTLPSKEMISAIIINADPYAAEFSEPGKSRVEIITKPAANRLRGELNFYFGDESLNARNFFAAHRAPFQSRHFSGVLSAPIKRERWGFIAEYSQNGLDDNAVINAFILNPATLQPARFNSTITAPTRSTNFSIRTTRLFGTKHTFDTRYLFSKEVAENQGLDGGFDLPERAYKRDWRSDTLRFSLVSTLSAVSLNELRFSMTRGHSLINALNSAPAVIVFDSFSAGGNQELLFLDETTRSLRAENNYTRIIGENHSLKLGASVSAVKIENTDRSNFGGSFIFGADLERGPTGLPAPNGFYISPLESYQRTVQRLAGYRPLQFVINEGDPFAAVTQWETNFFAQDNWQISKRLTLSYGLRAEFQTNLNKTSSLAPRIGIAVRPFKKDTSTLRAGAGLFYTRVDPYVSIAALRFDGVRQEELVIVRPPFFPVVPQIFNRATAQTILRPKSPELRAPYAFITTLSYERQLPKNLVASFTYNFERGVHLLRIRNINAPLPNTNSERPNSEVGPVLQFESSGFSRRQEFVAALHGDFGWKFNFYGSYRLAIAKNDTDGTKIAPADSYNTASEFGYSKFDNRHQFYLQAYALLPWKISFSPNLFISSGTPFNITTGSDNNGDTLFTDRPSFANRGDAGAVVTRFGTFNLQPQPGETIIPRNFGRGTGNVSLNLNISRTFGFGAKNANRESCAAGRIHCGVFNRRYRLSFSGDVYNVLNRANFGEFNGVLSSPLFGQPNRAADARRINLGVTLRF